MTKGIHIGMSMLPNIGNPSPDLSGMSMSSPAEASKEGEKKSKPKPLTDEELEKFGKFAPSDDTKEIAKYLLGKGLVGGEQLLTDHPDITKKDGIINAQSDWKPAAISKMLIRARQLGLSTPTEIKANREALMGALDGRVKDGLNHPAFAQIHPNFWATFDSVLKDQYAKETNLSAGNTVAVK